MVEEVEDASGLQLETSPASGLRRVRAAFRPSRDPRLRQESLFSGDTGLTEQFRETGEMYGPFDLVMLEIGAFHPGFEAIHLGPENALEVFQMLGGGTLLPVHWGTFDLALHAWDEPAETLVRLASERSMRVVTPSLGQVIEPSQLDAPTPWWRDIE